MKKLHKLTVLSFILLIIFMLIFLLLAEKIYTRFDGYTKYNLTSIIINITFSLLLTFNIILTFMSLMHFIVGVIKNKTFNIKSIILGIYPILLLLIICSFNINLLIQYILSPIKILLNNL